MLLFVILFNLVLTLINFYLVWQLRKLSHFLQKFTYQLTRLEQRIHVIFHPAPEIILKGQEGTIYLKKRYQSLKIKLLRLQQALSVLNFLLRILPQKRFSLKQKSSKVNLTRLRG
ncbi:hypothetical protein VB715_09770 [Crocosphaera sp. UHCC 0190]|uniref:hypothetical protein n=1 Tax=Crocosphaera sp. UHCC 0190 TaxID=3110246 RepID=UPI002B1FA146|nr:hypothetical protein [Crocosphaera sp. UHCC 0190]MEA5510051.1 hypothetical protein [Crocosphaera sp. UHCC 0190]